MSEVPLYGAEIAPLRISGFGLEGTKEGLTLTMEGVDYQVLTLRS